jgi:hypothetical protein
MTEIESKILGLLEGRRSPLLALTRAELELKTGLTDRLVRASIASLQTQGHPVISLGRGYWIGDQKDIDAYIRREKHRAITILQKLRRFLPRVDEMIEQLSLF